LDLLQQLASAAKSAGNGKPKESGSNASAISGLAASFVQHDPATGQPFLKLPVPSPEVLDRTLQAVGSLLELFRR
jgi:hypothetical protein